MNAVRQFSVPVVLSLILAASTQHLIAGVPAGSVEFSTGGVSVSETGGNAIITVHRIQIDGDAFTVSYSTVDGDARAGQDYAATCGTLSFAPFQTNATFSVPVLDDQQFEGIETVGLVLHDPTAGASRRIVQNKADRLNSLKLLVVENGNRERRIGLERSEGKCAAGSGIILPGAGVSIDGGITYSKGIAVNLDAMNGDDGITSGFADRNPAGGKFHRSSGNACDEVLGRGGENKRQHHRN